MERSSGILMPMFSLPSAYGIGTMGKSAYEFVDFLTEAGQKYWQLLPLGPTEAGDSPYSSPSTFAGNPYLIDLDMIIEEGILDKADADAVNWGEDPEKIDYSAMKKNRLDILRKAFEKGRVLFRDEIEAFYNENERWLKNYAMYMAIKQDLKLPWTEWPDDIRRRDTDALNEYYDKYKEEIDFFVFTQYLFFKQWNKLRSYAREKGISFIGDIPIYVALDSADVWSEPWFFQLDENYSPTQVSGCPPDAFNEDGQLWGNPLYDYDKMRDDGYGWWIRRIDGMTKLYDVIRIDHFRGLESYWSVPKGSESAKEGSWRKGPGMSLVGVLTSWFGNIQFIAEDLGYLTPDVKLLLEESKLPGMRLLEFAFDSDGDSVYLPHHSIFNCCCYTGTHDNDTILGWVDDMSEQDLEFAKQYMHITEDEGWAWGVIRNGMCSTANLFVTQMQDVLELGGDARINVPGIAEGNWRWRMLPGKADGKTAKKLYNMTKLYKRV